MFASFRETEAWVNPGTCSKIHRKPVTEQGFQPTSSYAKILYLSLTRPQIGHSAVFSLPLEVFFGVFFFIRIWRAIYKMSLLLFQRNRSSKFHDVITIMADNV